MQGLALALMLASLSPLSFARAPRPEHAAPSQAADAKTVTFGTTAPAVGDKSTSSVDTTLALDLTANQRRARMEQTEVAARRTEVLAVDGGLSKKIRVTYAKHEETGTLEGKTRPKVSPVTGNTYVVERRGESLIVTTPSGKSVTSEEQDKVERDHGRLGKPDRIGTALRSKPRKVGERLDDVATALGEDFKERAAGSGEKVSVTESKVVLSDVEQIDGVEHGVLDVVLRLVVDTKSAKLEMDLKGKALIRVSDVRFGEISMSGPVRLSDGHGASGTGHVALKTKTAP
jgi:hypothetical protein